MDGSLKNTDFNFYCTLFNSSYLLRGFTMLQSLLEKDPKAYIYVFPFDDEAYQSLSKLKIDRVFLVSLKEFETEDLLRVKKERSIGEYCWTCASWSIRHCIEKFNLPQCAYIDADLYFFSDPQEIFDEAKESSILITEHRYTPEYDQTKTSGRFCVQFIEFKNDSYGLEALVWWTERCLEWCFNRLEDGKFGDQKYLDDWIYRFKKVHVLNHLGGGIAPWNIQQYDLSNSCTKENIVLKEISSGKDIAIIFYHFHEIKMRQSNIALNLDYKISPEIINIIHTKYFNLLYSNSEYFSKIGILSEKFTSLQNCLISSFNEAKIQLQQTQSQLEQTQLQLWQELSISQLFCAEEGNYDYSKCITLHAKSSTELLAFSFVYDLIFWSQPITEFLWLPMWRSSCEVIIDSIELITDDDTSHLLSVTGGNYQRESKEKGSYKFISGHGIILLKWQNTKGKQLKINGSWRVIDTWNAHVEYSKDIQALYDKENQINSILNSKSFLIGNWIVRKLAWIRKWF
jgi:hypothetical protein